MLSRDLFLILVILIVLQVIIKDKSKSKKARAGRATFAADYSLGPGEAPLLSFDPGNWEAPFAVPEE